MEINPARQAAIQTLILNTGQASAKALSVGQLLNASVVSTANGEVTLNINNALLNARTALALLPGQKIELVVTETGKQTLLQLTSKSTNAAVLTQGMRQNLPKQIAQTEVLANLNTLTRTPEKLSSLNLPAPIQNLARQIMKNLPDTKEISSAKGLKQALDQSGVFLENKLRQTSAADNTASPRTDLKAGLLQLQTLLRQNIPSSIPPVKQISKEQLPLLAEPVNRQLRELANSNTLSKLSQLSIDAKLPAIGQRLEQLRQLVLIQLKNAQATTATPEQASSNVNPVDKTLTLLQSLFSLTNTLISELSQSPLAKTDLNQSLTGQLLGLRASLEKIFIQSQNKQAGTSQAAEQSTGKASLLAMKNPAQAIQELLRQTEGAISRIQMQQLNSAAEQEAGRLLWSLELPVRHGDDIDLLRMRIKKEQANAEADEKDTPITVMLNLDLDQTGPISVRLTLLRDQVSLVIWAENAPTLEEARDGLPQLEQRLNQNGLKSDNLTLLHGKPPPEQEPELTENHRLLDLKA